MLPVTGLPPHVTAQSTPAFALSPTGIMLSWAVPPAASEVNCDAAPLALVTEMAPAFTPEVETLPQPDASMPSTVMPRAAHRPRLASNVGFCRIWPEHTDRRDKI